MGTHRSCLLTIALVLALCPTYAVGGYDKSSWGMRLVQVMSIYPGGTASISDGGQVDYVVVQQVASFSALATFHFEREVLRSVALMFPAQDARLIPGNGVFPGPSHVEGLRIFRVLLDGLLAKYGASKEPAANVVTWTTGDTFVGLMAAPVSDTAMLVSIYYRPTAAKPDTSGL